MDHRLGLTALALLILAAMGPGCGRTPESLAITPASVPPATIAQMPTTLPATVSPAGPELEASPTAQPEVPSLQPSEATANADVTHVRAVQSSDGTWTFQVTVQHPDTGWEDYADGWDVVAPDGIVLKPDPESRFTRTLLHPHQNEQPFTRSQSGIVIPEGITEVSVRAHDIVDGFGGREVVLDLTEQSGPDFEVEHFP